MVIEEVLSTRESHHEGGRLADPLRKISIFPSMVTHRWRRLCGLAEARSLRMSNPLAEG